MTIIRILTNGYSRVTRESLLATIAFLVALLTALVLHEIAHGLVAYWNGDITAKYYGRLSLNPAKHFDIIGLIMMLFVGFGWAKPVPVNPNNFKNRKVGAFTVSLAGIVTNLILAFLFSALFVFMGMILPTVVGETSYYIVYFLLGLGRFTAELNVNFALFNLLPLYPLDGYRLLSCFVDERKSAMVAIRKYSLYIMLALLLLDRLPFMEVSPFDWYIGRLGGAILGAFQKFWGLFV